MQEGRPKGVVGFGRQRRMARSHVDESIWELTQIVDLARDIAGVRHAAMKFGLAKAIHNLAIRTSSNDSSRKEIDDFQEQCEADGEYALAGSLSKFRLLISLIMRWMPELPKVLIHLRPPVEGRIEDIVRSGDEGNSKLGELVQELAYVEATALWRAYAIGGDREDLERAVYHRAAAAAREVPQMELFPTDQHQWEMEDMKILQVIAASREKITLTDVVAGTQYGEKDVRRRMQRLADAMPPMIEWPKKSKSRTKLGARITEHGRNLLAAV